METYHFEKDISVICVTAPSFPEGISEVYHQLHSVLPSMEGRNFFGISYPNREGAIIYKAAAEEAFEGEAEKQGCEIFTINKGSFTSKTLIDWRKDETIIGRTFRELLSDPCIDKNGYCLEVYNGKNEVKCMVRLDASKV
ncbi:MAG: transcriptional regulator [Bacteroidota bacterium]|nr:transcriptional regulator [Bacteroidota bacterium]